MEKLSLLLTDRLFINKIFNTWDFILLKQLIVDGWSILQATGKKTLAFPSSNLLTNSKPQNNTNYTMHNWPITLKILKYSS